ncbi:MAG: methylaspartate mutase accessory protein GlmL, partial [Abditibacteriales bacterium]|nr:methylaspartate mutase accessory protein GlmL [Abditibacteriales bacterium]MDW8364766.1 methylaspartate mutase accessory protein GlmL [Abditibacteriales bacterium]
PYFPLFPPYLVMFLLLDIGSTYTKALIVRNGSLVAQGVGLTTVDSDVSVGVRNAVQNALGSEFTFHVSRFRQILVCSSAAGGLKIVAIGRTASLTAHAARQAALGAGGKVVGAFVGALNDEQVRDIERLRPDVILLTGGTDGGDTTTIVHNAKMIADSRWRCPIVVAGNAAAREQVASTLNSHPSTLLVVDNVLPEPDRLHLAPAREAIRQVFAQHIIEAKGLHKVRAMTARDIIPTPAAVLNAAQLIAEHLGELMVVDVGGATTDVHSVADGAPKRLNVISHPDAADEPYVKRTVEGDLGMRVSALTVWATAGAAAVCKKAGVSATEQDRAHEVVARFAREVSTLPQTAFEQQVEIGLGRACVTLAVERHVGRLSVGDGRINVIVQTGKDLSHVRNIIGTGGVFAHSPHAATMLTEAAASAPDSVVLKPHRPTLWLDTRYVLWAVGLLSQVDKEGAWKLAESSLRPVDYDRGGHHSRGNHSA